MSFPKIIFTGGIVLFVFIGVFAFLKKKTGPSTEQIVIEEKIEEESRKPLKSPKVLATPPATPVAIAPVAPFQISFNASLPTEPLQNGKQVRIDPVGDDFPQMDRLFQLFSTGQNKLPIVETVTYESKVSWLPDRPAWIADYAAHFETSRHFIARSLNGRADYLTQKVSTGSRFNVFRNDKNIHFYLLVDTTRCKLGFYYVDLDTQERVLLKTYRIGLGRSDPYSPSGCLTPLGIYSLGNKVAIYQPGTMGYFHDQKVEMIRVFGTRWIPFDQEIEGRKVPFKGYGIHGAPWKDSSDGQQLVENQDCVGTYNGDGCVHLSSEDMEELYAIVITKPTFVFIVKDFHEASLPGVEVARPQLLPQSSSRGA